MEDRVRELEEKLKKSEDQRQKLKDNLVRLTFASQHGVPRTVMVSGKTTIDVNMD